jgi:hypothetical protein
MTEEAAAPITARNVNGRFHPPAVVDGLGAWQSWQIITIIRRRMFPYDYTIHCDSTTFDCNGPSQL